MLLFVQTAAEQPVRQQPSMRSSRTRVALAVGLEVTGVEMAVELRILIAICCKMGLIACSSSATKKLEEDQVGTKQQPQTFSHRPSSTSSSTASPAGLLVEL